MTFDLNKAKSLEHDFEEEIYLEPGQVNFYILDASKDEYHYRFMAIGSDLFPVAEIYRVNQRTGDKKAWDEVDGTPTLIVARDSLYRNYTGAINLAISNPFDRAISFTLTSSNIYAKTDYWLDTNFLKVNEKENAVLRVYRRGDLSIEGRVNIGYTQKPTTSELIHFRKASGSEAIGRAEQYVTGAGQPSVEQMALTPGHDFEGNNGNTLLFLPEQEYIDHEIKINDDYSYEIPEAFIANLSTFYATDTVAGESGGHDRAGVLIISDDPLEVPYEKTLEVGETKADELNNFAGQGDVFVFELVGGHDYSIVLDVLGESLEKPLSLALQRYDSRKKTWESHSGYEVFVDDKQTSLSLSPYFHGAYRLNVGRSLDQRVPFRDVHAAYRISLDLARPLEGLSFKTSLIEGIPANSFVATTNLASGLGLLRSPGDFLLAQASDSNDNQYFYELDGEVRVLHPPDFDLKREYLIELENKDPSSGYANAKISVDIIDDSRPLVIMGSRFGEILNGEALDDIIEGGGGDDIIDGGPGVDQAVYSGARNDYIVARDIIGWRIIIEDKRAVSDGTDIVTGVESFRFADSTLTLSELIGDSTLTTENIMEFTGDGVVDSTDALLMMRHMMGTFPGDAITQGIPNIPDVDGLRQKIMSNMERSNSLGGGRRMDIDGDGIINPLSDGLAIIQYIHGKGRPDGIPQMPDVFTNPIRGIDEMQNHLRDLVGF
jgi:hypothetical protein